MPYMGFEGDLVYMCGVLSGSRNHSIFLVHTGLTVIKGFWGIV